MMQYLALIITLFPLAYYVGILWKRKSWSLIDSFVFGTALYQVGANILLFKVGVDDYSLQIYYASTFCFYLSVFGSRWFPAGTRLSLNTLHLAPNRKLYSQFFIIGYLGCIFLNAFIFTVILYKFSDIIFFEGEWALLDVRKQIAGGERGYMWPGVIKQIRDIITPAVMAYCILFLRGRTRLYFLFPLVTVSTLAIFVGGQRFPIVVLMLVVSTSYLLVGQNKILNIFTITNTSIAILVLLVLLALNSALGRGDFSTGGLLSMVINIIDRVFLTVPWENYKVAEFFENANFEMFSIWKSELLSIIPGNRFTLSNEMHSYMGGSAQGNSTLGGAMSGYYNAGYAGVAVYVLLMLGLLSLINAFVERTKSRLLYSLRIVLFFLIPMWYSFFQMFLNGMLVFIFFSLMVILYKLSISTTVVRK